MSGLSIAPAIHKDELLSARLPAQSGLPDQTADVDRLRAGDVYSWKQTLEQFVSMQITDAVVEICRGRKLETTRSSRTNVNAICG